MSETKRTTKKKTQEAASKCLLNLRKSPDMSAEILRTMEPGERSEVVSFGDEWTELKEGYVRTVFLEVL